MFRWIGMLAASEAELTIGSSRRARASSRLRPSTGLADAGDTRRGVRYVAVVAVVGTALLALPAAAAAQANGSDCSHTTTGDSAAGVQAGGGGMTGTATLAVGACVNGPMYGAEGGSVEAGVGNGAQSYAVVDSDDQTMGPGYVGVSNYETGYGRSDCRYGGSSSGSGSNSGGCVDAWSGMPQDVSAVPAPTPVCARWGSWNDSYADGWGGARCFIDPW